MFVTIIEEVVSMVRTLPLFEHKLNNFSMHEKMSGYDLWVQYLLMLQGVMSCPECKNKLQVRISADDVSFFFFVNLLMQVFVYDCII